LPQAKLLRSCKERKNKRKDHEEGMDVRRGAVCVSERADGA